MGEGEEAVLPVCNCVCIVRKCANACSLMRLCLCMSLASCISLVSMSLMWGGGGNKIFASCDTDLFYHQLEVPVRRSIISN